MTLFEENNPVRFSENFPAVELGVFVGYDAVLYFDVVWRVAPLSMEIGGISGLEPDLGVKSAGNGSGHVYFRTLEGALGG